MCACNLLLLFVVVVNTWPWLFNDCVVQMPKQRAAGSNLAAIAKRNAKHFSRPREKRQLLRKFKGGARVGRGRCAACKCHMQS